MEDRQHQPDAKGYQLDTGQTAVITATSDWPNSTGPGATCCSFGTLPQGQSSQPGFAISSKFLGSLSHPVLRLFQETELGPKDPKKEVVCKRNAGVGGHRL